MYWPLALVTEVAVTLVSSLVAVTLTPGSTAPDTSTIVPTIVPVSSCASADDTLASSKTHAKTPQYIRFIRAAPSLQRRVYHKSANTAKKAGRTYSSWR